MGEKSFDIVIIGSGPGGYVAAIKAAQAGMHTALIERSQLGGTCLNRGCIPTKAMLHAAYMLQRIRSLEKLGIRASDVSLCYERMLNWRDGIVSTLRKGLEGLMRSNGVEVIKGEGRFLSADRLKVSNGETETLIEFKYAIIATGSKPRCLPCIRGDESCLIAEEALFMQSIPKSAAVIGAGAIGVELAWLLSSLGCSVTLFELMPMVLPTMDGSISRHVEMQLRRMNVKVATQTRVISFEAVHDGRLKLCWESAGNGSAARCEGEFEKVIVSIGRISDTASLNAEAANVQLCDDGRVMVDQTLRTTTPHIYAIGDVIRGGGFAHQAMAEGELAVEAILGANANVNDLVIPVCIYTHPEVASVGMSEEEMREHTDSVLIGEFPMRANGRALTCDELDGFVKFVGDGRTGKITGVHIVSAHASEMIGEATLAVQLGMKFDDYIKLVHPHPTISEALGEAARVAIDKPLHILKVVRRTRRA